MVMKMSEERICAVDRYLENEKSISKNGYIDAFLSEMRSKMPLENVSQRDLLAWFFAYLQDNDVCRRCEHDFSYVMGETKGEVDSWVIRNLLPRYSLKVHGCGAQGRLTIGHPDTEKEMRVRAFVSLKDRIGGKQAVFSFRGITEETIPWYIFVVKPWGKVFLRSRSELIEKRGVKEVVSLTISRSNGLYYFENRIAELLRDKAAWELVCHKK